MNSVPTNVSVGVPASSVVRYEGGMTVGGSSGGYASNAAMSTSAFAGTMMLGGSGDAGTSFGASFGSTLVGGSGGGTVQGSWDSVQLGQMVLGGINSGFTVPQANGSATLAPIATAASTTAPAAAAAAAPAYVAAPAGTDTRQLTSLAPGAQASDAALVETTLATLRGSAAGAQMVDRLLAVGAHINVVSDEEMTKLGFGNAHAIYDPQVDTMFLRRSDLADTTNRGFAAVALAHEGTHLLDDVGQLQAPLIAKATQQIIALGGPSTPAGAEAQRQFQFQIMMIEETRAFTFAGQVGRELNVTLPALDPTTIASAGGNNGDTYAKVWQALLDSAYNPERRTAPVSNFYA